MTIQELIAKARKASHLYLVIPSAKSPEGRTIGLCGRFGPRGDICRIDRVDKGFETLAVFESKAVLKFIASEVRKINASK